MATRETLNPPFWDNLEHYGDAVAIIESESGRHWTYCELAERVKRAARQISSSCKQLFFLPLSNKIGNIVVYLACLSARQAVLIYPEEISQTALDILVSRYQPHLVFSASDIEAIFNPDSVRVYEKSPIDDQRDPPHKSLALLVSTSGSSGSSKLVRLSGSNLMTNAWQIQQALQIGDRDRAITALPLSYVYGLSVLHSHLLAGASLVLERRSILTNEFWKAARSFNVTSLSGVPWTFQMMRKLRITQRELPSISKLTTAGAKTDTATADWMVASFVHARIYFMYGQAEASARISVLPPDYVRTKLGSVGKAVAGGAIECAADGSIWYSGPNVMLGYANSIDDLALGNLQQGRIDTGDVGYLDDDGFLFITGRKSSFCKLFGLRINLDEMRAYLQSCDLNAQIIQCQPDTITIRHDGTFEQDIDPILRSLASRWGIPKSAIMLEHVKEIPRLLNGKSAP